MRAFFTAFYLSLSLLSFGQINLQDSLVARYELNGHAIDSSGNMYDGTLHGTTAAIDRHGNPNGCLEFDGNNDYVSFGNMINIKAQSDVSISAWFYADPIYSSTNRYSGISFGTKNDGELTLRVMDEVNKFQTALYSSTQSSGSSSKSNVYTPNAWYHLVGTYSDGDVNLYVNGVLQADSNSSGSGGQFNHLTQNASLLFGKAFNTSNAERYFKGKLDDVSIYNRILNKCEIDYLYSGTTEGADSLIAHYTLNGNAIDFSGNNNHGNIFGASPTADRLGATNSALSFDGTDDFVFVGNIIDPSIRTGLTIEAWFKIESPIMTPNKYVGVSFGTKLTGELALRVNDDVNKRLQAFVSNGVSSSTNANSTSASTDATFSYNTWYHVIATYQDGNVNLYLDGALQSTFGSNGTGGSFSDLQSASELLIGKAYNSQNTPRFFKGKMDEVKIYNKALTSCDIEKIHQSTLLSTSEEESLNIENDLKVYPNPAKDFVNVTLKNSYIKNIELLTMNGTVLASLEFPNRLMDLSEFPAGVYILKVTDVRGLVQNSKIVIQ